MLMAATLTMVVVTGLLMSDTIIAGFFMGEEAVAAINLVTPAYSLAAFFGCIFSLGVSVLYSNAMGRFDKESADSYYGEDLLCLTYQGNLYEYPADDFVDGIEMMQSDKVACRNSMEVEVLDSNDDYGVMIVYNSGLYEDNSVRSFGSLICRMCEHIIESDGKYIRVKEIVFRSKY